MYRKTVLLTLLLAIVFAVSASAATMRYVPLDRMGIKPAVSNFYSNYRVNKTYSATVVDPVSVGNGNLFDSAYRGEKLKLTHLGDGMVRIEKTSTGESVELDARWLGKTSPRY